MLEALRLVRHVADVGCDVGHALRRLTGLFGGWLATLAPSTVPDAPRGLAPGETL